MSEILSNPLFYNTPQALVLFASSASASASTSGGNIANLRQTKAANLQDSLDDDAFFKYSVEYQQNEEKDQNENPMPNFVQRKLAKIMNVLGLLNSLSNPASPDNKVESEQDDFDKDFNEDFSRENLEQKVGYVYNKPTKANKSANQVSANRMDFSPANIGVFFLELIGSLVGLAYGAAAQLNHPGSTTTPTSI